MNWNWDANGRMEMLRLGAVTATSQTVLVPFCSPRKPVRPTFCRLCVSRQTESTMPVLTPLTPTTPTETLSACELLLRVGNARAGSDPHMMDSSFSPPVPAKGQDIGCVRTQVGQVEGGCGGVPAASTEKQRLTLRPVSSLHRQFRFLTSYMPNKGS